MSPTSYQAAPPRALDSTRLASVLQILRCPLRVQLGSSGIISLDLCKDPTLGASRGHGLHDSSKLDDLVEPFGLGERFVDALAARDENSLLVNGFRRMRNLLVPGRSRRIPAAGGRECSSGDADC